MLELFKKYKQNNQISEAILIGRNLFNKNPNNKEIFSEYFELLCLLGEKLPNIDERKEFINQAEITLAFYIENVDLTEEIIKEIESFNKKLEEMKEIIEKLEEEEYMKYKTNIQTVNNNFLKELFDIKDMLIKSQEEKEFQEKLLEISEMDQNINKDFLTVEQSKYYDILNKAFTEEINKKMKEFEDKKNSSYNKKAVDSFEKAFKLFKENEEKYKNETQLRSLVIGTLFAYDVSKLTNETLIYYNYIYSYIFNKLSDEGKLALTKFSIKSEKN